MATTPSSMTDPTRASSMSRLAAWIDRQPRVVLTVYAMSAAFAAYTSMYAFRKPFTASQYEGFISIDPVLALLNLNLPSIEFSYKSIAVIAQLIGYVCSKFIAIKVASEATYARRVPLVLGLILTAEVMLVFFGLVPRPWNIIFLFLNGLPLGMVWSLLFGLLEGRRVTEFLGLGMSVSVIFSSGWVKAIGRWTVEDWGVSEYWMPALTGLLFIPVLVIALGMLRHVPPPDARDAEERTERRPMDKRDRRLFIRRHFVGLTLLVLAYLALMTYRDLRDSFMPDILEELGAEVNASTFARIESLVGLLVIAALCGLWFFRNNRHAVWANMTLVGLGAVLLGVAAILLRAGLIGPEMFYVLNGIGLYSAFIPFQSILMDRLLASLHTVATASFLIAIADSFGYFSTVSLYIGRDIYVEVFDTNLPWSELLIMSSYVVLVGVPLMMLFALLYFRPQLRN